MTGLSLATCNLALPPGRAPEWVHIFPGDGQVKGRDGRAWELIDPSALVLAFQSGGIDLPIDYEHQNDTPEPHMALRSEDRATVARTLPCHACKGCNTDE